MNREAQIQAQMAELQLDMMKETALHMRKLREIELRKAQVELDTAETINAAVKRVEAAQQLPSITINSGKVS